MDLRHNSPANLKLFLEAEKLALSKRFGQNFLLNPATRTAIVDQLGPGKDDIVWEIGPGLGALTGILLERAGRVCAFEIDRGFVEALGRIFHDSANFLLIEGDFIKTWPKTLEERGRPDGIIGNLPYNASSQIIAGLVEAGMYDLPMVFTVQKEMARRMLAQPGTKDYSSFTVLLRTFVTIKRCFDIQPGSFFPRPEVVSTVVKLTPGPAPDIPDKDYYFGFVRALFASRRKTILNNLCAAYGSKDALKDAVTGRLTKLNISPDARGETLTVEQIVICADNMRSILL